MKKYIVCWVKISATSAISNEYTDHYKVFIDGSSKENKKAAMKKYKSLLTKKKVYSANICKVIKSTDY